MLSQFPWNISTVGRASNSYRQPRQLGLSDMLYYVEQVANRRIKREFPKLVAGEFAVSAHWASDEIRLEHDTIRRRDRDLFVWQTV